MGRTKYQAQLMLVYANLPKKVVTSTMSGWIKKHLGYLLFYLIL